ILSAIRALSRMMMPKPVRPPPVIAPSSVCVKPYCSAHWPRMPARIENPTPDAMIAMNPAQSRRYALGAATSADFITAPGTRDGIWGKLRPIHGIRRGRFFIPDDRRRRKGRALNAEHRYAPAPACCHARLVSELQLAGDDVPLDVVGSRIDQAPNA